MDPSDARKELTGLARSIDALFDPSVDDDTSEEDMVWEEVEKVTPTGPDAADADPQAMHAAVTAFLTAPHLEREGLGSRIRTEAGALRQADALDVLADVVERLITESGDPADEACVAMAQALLTPGVADRIVDRLGEARDERRKELVRICGALGEGMAQAIADALTAAEERASRHIYLDTLVTMGDVAMPTVEAMVEDPEWFVVRNGAAILGRSGGAHAIELLVGTLAHPDARVRREALLSLARVGGEDAGMLVYGMIEDPDPEVRLAAATAAGQLKVERALRPLLALLDDEGDDDVAIAIVQALGELGDPGAVNAIEKRAVGTFFSRPPIAVRIAAYRALHKIGTPHAKSLLVQATDDKDAQVKVAVRQILGMR